MESMLCFGNRNQLIPTLLPTTSNLSSLQKNKINFSLRHTSDPSLTIGNTWDRTSRHRFPPVICALDESRNGRKNSKIEIAASIGLACIMGIIGVSWKMNSKAIAGPKELYQKAPRAPMAYPLGGRAALKSLMDVTVYLSSSKFELPGPLSRLPSRPSVAEVDGIKMEAVLQMKYGKPEDAVKRLREAYQLYEHDPEPAFNVEMALVEILICQGKYDEASECNCLKDDQLQLRPSDARLPLYKAIIYTMLDEKQEAKKWWDEYLKTVDQEEFDPKML